MLTLHPHSNPLLAAAGIWKRPLFPNAANTPEAWQALAANDNRFSILNLPPLHKDAENLSRLLGGVLKLDSACFQFNRAQMAQAPAVIDCTLSWPRIPSLQCRLKVQQRPPSLFRLHRGYREFSLTGPDGSVLRNTAHGIVCDLPQNGKMVRVPIKNPKQAAFIQYCLVQLGQLAQDQWEGVRTQPIVQLIKTQD